MKKCDVAFHTLITITCLLCVISLYSCYAQNQEVKASIEIYSNGAAHVTMKMSNIVSENVSLSLIGNPDPDFLLVYDEENIPLLFKISDGIINVYPMGSSTIIVEYVTYSLCSMSMGIWSINISSPYDFTLILPGEAEVTYISSLPTSISTQDNKLTMTFNAGRLQVEYIMPAVLPQPPQQGQQLGGSAQQIGGGGQVTPQPLIPWHFLVIGIIVVAAIATTIAIVARRKTASLSGVESAIVGYLKNRGGSAFQEEIARDLSIPKSTLSRAIASLKSKGMIKIKKVSRRNYIILT